MIFPPSVPPEVRLAADRVLAYLAETDPLPRAVDAVIGFGVFDLSLARYCAELYRSKRAARIVFTGGFGAGTGNLGGPEADVWRAEVKRAYPDIGDDAFVVENRSTNTAENIEYTARVLRDRYPSLTFGVGIKSAIIVASPSRLRRVRLTMSKLQPTVTIWRAVPDVDLEREYALYTSQGVNYVAHLVGEIDRLLSYPARGWIIEEKVPAEVLAATEVLRRNGVSS